MPAKKTTKKNVKKEDKKEELAFYANVQRDIADYVEKHNIRTLITEMMYAAYSQKSKEPIKTMVDYLVETKGINLEQYADESLVLQTKEKDKLLTSFVKEEPKEYLKECAAAKNEANSTALACFTTVDDFEFEQERKSFTEHRQMKPEISSNGSDEAENGSMDSHQDYDESSNGSTLADEFNNHEINGDMKVWKKHNGSATQAMIYSDSSTSSIFVQKEPPEADLIIKAKESDTILISSDASTARISSTCILTGNAAECSENPEKSLKPRDEVVILLSTDDSSTTVSELPEKNCDANMQDLQLAETCATLIIDEENSAAEKDDSFLEKSMKETDILMTSNDVNSSSSSSVSETSSDTSTLSSTSSSDDEKVESVEQDKKEEATVEQDKKEEGIVEQDKKEEETVEQSKNEVTCAKSNDGFDDFIPDYEPDDEH